MARLLVIDDEQAICWGLAQLGKRLGHEVQTASSGEQGLKLAAASPPDVVLLDVRLPGMDGLATLARLREQCPTATVIIMTAHGELGTAVEAVRLGAFDYVAKPFDLAQIERILERVLAAPVVKSPATLDTSADGLVGRTAAMQEVFKRIALVAPAEACVMLSGESGTGKEVVARAIHRYSCRAAGPFVAVNVAALNPTVAESELFGHVRGAFTGADQARAGLLVDADGGTLFLDEVADIPLPVQVKLLRALEQGEVLPVGSGKTVRTSFRLITATHQDLPGKVRSGAFRHDLYYRLSTFQIELPPLRGRREDIPLLVDYFVGQLRGAGAKPPVSQRALDEILVRPWHGNVRELRNAIEHALILARDGVILPEHLPTPIPPLDLELPLAAASARSMSSVAGTSTTRSTPADEVRILIQAWAQQRLKATGADAIYDELLTLVEPPLLEAALRKHHGQCAAAARVLGMHRTTLKKKLDQYGIAGEE
ncbi:MAG: sigma-54 dependent transcriptional regulator [Pirellulaceae bacterium]|nr:sigma-54 dependent transcriptional regulator [Pirellulaceae bacterium]